MMRSTTRVAARVELTFLTAADDVAGEAPIEVGPLMARIEPAATICARSCPQIGAQGFAAAAPIVT